MITTKQMNVVFQLYPQIKKMIDDTAYDADGNKVAYDLASVQALVDSQAYIAKRQAEYPPITDYLDGVVKGDQDQIDAYIAACLAVKAKYPK
jgi:hypothetical protein